MLRELAEFAQKVFPDVEPGFGPVTIRWRIRVPRETSGVWTIEPFGEEGMRHPAAPVYPANLMQSGGKCHFLIDELRTSLLLLDKKDDSKKYQEKSRFFLELLKEAAPCHPDLETLVLWLSNSSATDEMRQWLQAHGAASADRALFLVDGLDLSRTEECRQWWRSYRRHLVECSHKTKPMVCLLSGEVVAPAKTHDKVSGLKRFGGRGQDVVVGYDKSAFTSYGLDQNENGAMSEGIAKAYVQGLDYLIQKQRRDIGNAAVVYWFKESVPPEDDPFAMLHGMETDEQQTASALSQARKLLDAIRTGKRARLGDNHYYAMTISGASGRVMVRDWMQGPFAQLVANIESWFSDLSIAHREGEGLAPDPKFLAVCGALIREGEELKRIPPSTSSTLWRAAIARLPIPQPVLAQALDRFRSALVQDQVFNHARMGHIKAYFVRKSSGGDQHMKPHLNPDHPDPAYHCGRLLAVLAKLQHAALGDVGAGVVQRFYPAASTAPGLTLGRLVGNARNHLGKLEGGLSFWYEQQIAGVMGQLGDSIPRTLNLEEQGLFALGYYQQLAALRAGNKHGQDNNQDGAQV